jgi:ribosomal protein S18 acetylase RimI-like enzyme
VPAGSAPLLEVQWRGVRSVAGDRMLTERAAAEADRESLYALHVASMREYVTATYGWDDALQRRLFLEDWPRVLGQLRVLVDGERIAAAYRVERRPAELYLASIEVHSDFQGRGVGTAIIRALMAQAAARKQPFSLFVMKANPRAQALYLRLGLRVVAERPTHYAMQAG